MAQKHRGKRSKEAVERRRTNRAQRKAANKFVIEYSFNDREKHEVICRSEECEIQHFLGVQFGIYGLRNGSVKRMEG